MTKADKRREANMKGRKIDGKRYTRVHTRIYGPKWHTQDVSIKKYSLHSRSSDGAKMPRTSEERKNPGGFPVKEPKSS